MRRLILSVCIATSFQLFAFLSHAQDEEVGPIFSDRPAETDAIPTIPKGYFQIEAGIGFTRTDNDSYESSAFSYPAATFKYGILNSLELRAFFNRASSDVSALGTESKLSAHVYYFSAKANIIHERGWVPEASLIFGWTFSDTFVDGQKTNLSSDNPAIRMVFSNTLSDKVSLAYSIGHIGDWSVTIVPALVLGQKWDIFLEYYTIFEFGNVTGFYTDGFNLGTDFIVNNNFKLDFMIGLWLDSEIFNGYAVTGLAWRFN